MATLGAKRPAQRVLAAAIAGGVLAAGALACVDLFHGTDFKTLCEEKPSDPACVVSPLEAGSSDAGLDAAPPRIDFCAFDAKEALDRAVRACAYLGACTGPLGESAFGECVFRAQLAFDCVANPTLRPRGAADDFWQCLASVRACADVEKCAFAGPRQDCPLVSSGKFTTCSTVAGGRVRIECTAPGGAAGSGVEPCISSGRSCAKLDDSFASCTGKQGYGVCDISKCDGTSVVDCQPSGGTTIDRGVDCASMGAGACVSEEGRFACAAGEKASACDAGGGGPAVTCSADEGAAVACVGGKELRVDCARLGMTCDVQTVVPVYDPAAACAERNALDPDFCTVAGDTCAGDKLVACSHGRQYEADCVKLGLGPCVVLAGRGSCRKP